MRLMYKFRILIYPHAVRMLTIPQKQINYPILWVAQRKPNYDQNVLVGM